MTLADKAVEAINITLLADWTANDTWVYKFSVLTLRNNAFTCKSPILTVAVGFKRDLTLWTVGEQVAAETFCLEKAITIEKAAGSVTFRYNI